MNKNKLKILSLVCVISSILFSLLNISFSCDISIISFPIILLFSGVLYYSTYYKLFVCNNLKFISVMRELLQYGPYILLVCFVFRRAGNNGTLYILDFFAVLFWLVFFIFSLVILHYLNPKKLEKIDLAWKKHNDALLSKSKLNVKSFFMEIVGWIDAIVQSVFMVLLLNIFIVQLYEIPSESMVPEFLVKDRVIVFKTASGPKFPLSDVGLPYIKNYKRGDIVVFRNPHYSSDRKSEVRTFLSQIVFMCTLTTVNINVDDSGNPKADPLVKRIVGVPGEQLMMQDGILYSRTFANDNWNPVTEENKWACWNLNNVKYSIKKDILDFPVSKEEYDTMLEVESLRNSLDLKISAQECYNIANRFDNAFKLLSMKKEIEDISTFFDSKNMLEYSLFSKHSTFVKNILSAQNGNVWFRKFMTDWITTIKTDFNGNLYDEANYKLNIMIKKLVGSIFLRDAELLSQKYDITNIKNDYKLYEYMKEAEKLNSYIYLLDRRNMPIFPKNKDDGTPQYIPENSYFMMGDNRFNSLDMRHSYDLRIEPLTVYDKYSVFYYSNMNPQLIKKDKILGETSYRFWPLNRRGVPGHTGM